MGSGESGLYNTSVQTVQEDSTSQKVSFPPEDSQIKHIFRKRGAGHLLDTEENRKKILELANDNNYYVGLDKYGNKWNVKIDDDGYQLWVEHRNGIIQEGGRNYIPKKWNVETGLNKPPYKKK